MADNTDNIWSRIGAVLKAYNGEQKLTTLFNKANIQCYEEDGFTHILI